MRIGYPCINRTIGCSANKTFRLKSYSKDRLEKTIKNNLDCLERILTFNRENKIFFFRITSDLIPFASHPINKFNWKKHFKEKFVKIGEYIAKNRMRISMHPDQFTLINSVRTDIFERAKKELQYHADILNLMNLDTSSKIQIHVGGVYGDKKRSIKRFIARFKKLDSSIRNRLVIENDDRLYSLNDCLEINAEVKIPVLFDYFHNKLNFEIQMSGNYLENTFKTWNSKTDGLPMADYSSQEVNGMRQRHSETINVKDFCIFLEETKPFDLDIMLEIKDKEKSAIKALSSAIKDARVCSFLQTTNSGI